MKKSLIISFVFALGILFSVNVNAQAAKTDTKAKHECSKDNKNCCKDKKADHKCDAKAKDHKCDAKAEGHKCDAKCKAKCEAAIGKSSSTAPSDNDGKKIAITEEGVKEEKNDSDL